MQDLSKYERLNQIIRHTSISGKVDMRSLSELFGVSVDTIRRDIKELAERGTLEAVRGGAVCKSPIPPDYRDRLLFDTTEKKKIALKAVQLIKEGQVISLNGGTSIVALASVLPKDISFTVVTNSFPVVSELEQHNNIEILFAGGRLSKRDHGTTGSETLRFFHLVRADIYFMAPFSIHTHLGVTTNSFENAAMDKAMIETSKKVVALVTASKINTAENYHVCSLDAVDTIVTELEPDDERLSMYKENGIEIL